MSMPALVFLMSTPLFILLCFTISLLSLFECRFPRLYGLPYWDWLSSAEKSYSIRGWNLPAPLSLLASGSLSLCLIISGSAFEDQTSIAFMYLRTASAVSATGLLLVPYHRCMNLYSTSNASIDLLLRLSVPFEYQCQCESALLGSA